MGWIFFLSLILLWLVMHRFKNYLFFGIRFFQLYYNFFLQFFEFENFFMARFGYLSSYTFGLVWSFV